MTELLLGKQLDLLTAYDSNTITYDAIGNPTSCYNGTRWSFGWQNGRQLATATSSGIGSCGGITYKERNNESYS